MYRRRQQFEMLMVLFRRPLPLNCLLFTMDGNSRWTCAIHSHNLFSGWYFGPDLYHPFTQLILRMAIRAGLLPSIHATYFQDGILRRACAIHSHNLFSGWQSGPDLCHPFTQLIFRMVFPLRFMPSAENCKPVMVKGLLINAASPCSVALLN